MTEDLPLTPEDVAEIVAILELTPYERIDIRARRFKLSVLRSGEGWAQCWDWPEQDADSGATGTSAAAAATPALQDEAPDGMHAIRAQLPGTFYRAPEPGAPPFVEIGSRVDPETVVGIIETMKLMSPVHAGATGIVAAILVDNASPVHAQAALIRIKSDGQ